MMLSGYENAWSELNGLLRRIEGADGGLSAAFSELQRQQREAGFINDGLERVERYYFQHPDDPLKFFRVQYNPKRALRFNGAGRTNAPAGTVPSNDGCFLCRDNVRWQQRGAQLGYEIDLPCSLYIAWMNPFPLLPMHVVVASAEHRSQDWIFRGKGDSDAPLILGDFLEIANRLPGHVGYFNGVDSGASIPGHLHFQFCKRPQDAPEFPLEIAARRSTSNVSDSGLVEEYPLAGAFWRGSREDVFNRAWEWIEAWAHLNRNRLRALTANLVVSKDKADGDLILYFIPRDRGLARSGNLTEQIGGLEVLGEFVFSSQVEKRLLDDGSVDYFTIEEWLARVHTPLYVE